MKRFCRYFSSELSKWLSLPTFWYGLLFVLGVSIFFTAQCLQVIQALASGDAASVGLDSSDALLLFKDPATTVSDAFLASPYQTSVAFIPILAALLAVQEYRFRQDITTTLITGSWGLHLAGRAVAAMAGAIFIALLCAVANGAAFALFLPDSLKPVLTPLLAIETTGRVFLFTITLTLAALAIVEITRQAIPALIVVAGLLILSLSGILNAVYPGLNNLLPLLGAKSFAFGYAAGDTSQLYGVLLLLGWSFAALLAIFLFGRRSRVSKRGR